MSETFDPRDFIVPPFTTCPSCGHPDYGVLSACVGPDNVHRRCRQCWRTDVLPLPPIQKKIIYLDQFAISNLMLVRAKTEKPVLQFWHKLYEKLLHLSRLQLIVCPASAAHPLESTLAPNHEQLQNA